MTRIAKVSRHAAAYITFAFLSGISACDNDNEVVQTIDLESGQVQSLSASQCRKMGLEIVHLQGKIKYFGADILVNPPARHAWDAGVADAKIWIAEYPFTRLLNITSDEDGYWSLNIIKLKNRDLKISFVYEKDFYPPEIEALVFPNGLPEGWDSVAVQSNIYTIGNEDISDAAIQMPDELYLAAAKMQLEAGISSLIGQPYSISNLMVSTVGMPWASIFDPTLPHGDPGAVVIMTPTLASPLQGPIYFDETVSPNPLYTSTSVDGGVLFDNLPPGSYAMTADLAPYTYEEVSFNVHEEVHLYISSPPHSIQRMP
jgi:hypothetical protein